MTAFSGSWFQRRVARRAGAAEAYRRLLRHALDPVHYLESGAPDTFEGRAGMVTLMTSLNCVRLSRISGPDAAWLIGRLNDLVVDGFDAAYREKGVGDASIARKVRALAQAHAGAGKALFAALAPDNASGADIAAILMRNGFVVGGHGPVMAEAALAARDHLAGQLDDEILQGRVDWAAAQTLHGPARA